MRESEILELKKSTSELKEALISLASILNKHQKGELYFGVNRDGEIVGQTVTENSLREVSRAIAEHIEPKIFPKVEEVVIEGKHCIHVEFTGNNVPYYAQGRAYMRVGDEDRQMSAKEIERLILQKNQDKMRWDVEICIKAKLTDINTKRLQWFLKKSGRRYQSLENSLDKLGLLKGEKLRNTAVMLFGKKPQQFFPNAKLRCAVFGTTGTSLILDRQEFEGNIFSLIEKAEEYILKNIHIGMKLEGLYRVDVPEINKEAFREAIINAFCHRDYYEYDSVNIAIFRDRMEIRSPGGLYGGLTIDQIKKKRVSRRRNELIADMFHLVHFVEKWGRGIELILSKEPTADFEEVAGIFIATFKRRGVEDVGVNVGVNVGVESLLEHIRNHPGQRAVQFAGAFEVTTRTIERWIKQLKGEEKIEFRGSPKKGGYWVITKS